MSSTSNRTILHKKMMAVAGLIWFFYIVFHLFSVSTLHSGEASFNDFFMGLNGSVFYPVLLALLGLTILFHVYIAITRQLNNNSSVGERYKKPYPKAIPRAVAWLGAFVMFGFIIIHSFQMLTTKTVDLYSQLHLIFSHPIMLAIYGFGILALSTHLYHGLTNVLQTLGFSSNKPHNLALVIVVVIGLGFASIPIGILYA